MTAAGLSTDTAADSSIAISNSVNLPGRAPLTWRSAGIGRTIRWRYANGLHALPTAMRDHEGSKRSDHLRASAGLLGVTGEQSLRPSPP